MTRLRILALEPYAARSHQQFLDGLVAHSRHRIEVATLPARKWKWRMRTAALHYAPIVAAEPWDALLVSDYVNLAELRAILPRNSTATPTLLYFHENQLTYPLQEGEFLDYQFAITHLYAMLAAEHVAFNSEFHRRELLAGLRRLLRLVPDVEVRTLVDSLEPRTSVLPLGIDGPRAARTAPDATETPVIVWNHRWEYDKNPGAFLRALLELDRRKCEFSVRLLGQRFRTIPTEFRELLEQLSHRIVDSAYPESAGDYRRELAAGHVVVSTAIHEFFGLATLEAIRAGLYPVLPRDLAYPELLPRGLHDTYLYDPATGPVEAIERALRRVREPGWAEEREELQAQTDRYGWSQLIERYDATFEEVAHGTPLK